MGSGENALCVLCHLIPRSFKSMRVSGQQRSGARAENFYYKCRRGRRGLGRHFLVVSAKEAFGRLKAGCNKPPCDGAVQWRERLRCGLRLSTGFGFTLAASIERFVSFANL